MEMIYMLVLICYLPFVICEYDPCISGNYEILNNWERSVNNKYGKLCDFILKEGWYRPISLVGNTMPTECPVNGFRCGTAVPIWMNGSYPLPETTVDVVACGSHYEGDCCFYAYDIKVKNCGEYFVYKLKKTEGCRQAYCFGTEVKCKQGQTSDNGGFTPGCEFDPCHPMNYRELTGEIKRSSNYTLQSNDNAIEDSRLITGWYKIDSTTGNDIVNESVSIGQCGTLYPMWMMGNIPEVSDKTVDRKMCRSNLTDSCAAKIDIQVRNCGSYRTYHLQRLNVDKSAYCFGTLTVPETTIRKSTTTSSIENHDHYRPVKERASSLSEIVIGVCIALACLVLLVILISQLTKKRNEKMRVLSFSNVQAEPKTDPPSYAETMENNQNNLRQENHKLQSKGKLILETEGCTVGVWSISSKSSQIQN